MTRLFIPKPPETVRRSLRVPVELDGRIQNEANLSGVTVSRAMIVLLQWGMDAIDHGTAELVKQLGNGPGE